MEHIYAVNFRASLHEWPVEEVSVIGHKHCGLDFLDMTEKASQALLLMMQTHRCDQSGESVMKILLGALLQVGERTSLGSLKIVNKPSYSGLGVYSKSSMS